MTAPLLTATITPPNPAGWLALGVLLWLVGYAAVCVVYPYTAHSRCAGTGKLRSPSGRAWRRCRGCRGTGRKVRVGRRVWGAVRADTRRRPS